MNKMQIVNFENFDEKTTIDNSWDFVNKSEYIVQKDEFTATRIRVANQTVGIKTKINYNHGIHVWRIEWEQTGTHTCIGFGTKNTPIIMNEYISLIGYDHESYGFDLINKYSLHNNNKIYYDFDIPKIFYIYINFNNRNISIIINNVFYTLFDNIDIKKKYFLMASLVYGDTNIKCLYSNIIVNPLSCLSISKHIILKNILNHKKKYINDLEIPKSLKIFLRDD